MTLLEQGFDLFDFLEPLSTLHHHIVVEVPPICIFCLQEHKMVMQLEIVVDSAFEE